MPFLLSIMLLASFAVAAQKPHSAGRELSVIAYYSGDAREIDRYDVRKLTHLIFSFSRLKGNTLYVSPQAGLILKKLVSLKKKNASLKVSLAFAGWGGCRNCSDLFRADNNRKAFAASVKRIIQQHRLDGIDIDWEYPAIQGPIGHPFSKDDKQNFTLLMQELRKSIGDGKELTVATGAFTEFLQQSIEWSKVAAVVDRFHLMTYDLVNRNSKVTGHHAALYSANGQPESTDNALRYLDSLGIPRNKLVIGAAFYARVFQQVGSTRNGLGQACTFKGFVTYRSFASTFSKANGYAYFWDEAAKAPWYYNAGKKLFATFDDKRSVQSKTQYAINKKLNGIMFWELRQDLPAGGLLDAIHSIRKSSH